MSLDTPFLLDLTVLPLAVFKVDFFATAGSCRIWLDAGRCLSSEVPNTVRAVLDKYPKFVNQLCSKCASENWIEVDQILREVGIDEAEDATHDDSNDATHDDSNDATHDASNDATHDASNDATHDVSNDATHDVSNDATHDASNDATHDASNDATHDAHRTTRLPPARNLLNPWTARVTFPFEDLILFVDTVPDTCTPPLTNLEC
jgi:hypothetical protein